MVDGKQRDPGGQSLKELLFGSAPEPWSAGTALPG